MEKNQQTEMLNKWGEYICIAMKAFHQKFKKDSKIVLTESDLKCWLFYYLQQEKPSVPFAVHSEVTHYALHSNLNLEPEKKYKFRDISLLCPWIIKDNEEIWDSNNNDITYNKGFKHNGPAMHFELKMIRQPREENQQVEIQTNDISKLKTYTHNSEFKRSFVIVWASRSECVSVNTLFDKLKASLKDFNNQSLNGLLEFYLFDAKKIIYAKWQEKKLHFNEI